MTKFSKTNLALNNPLNKSIYTFGVEGSSPPQQFKAICNDLSYSETFHYSFNESKEIARNC